MLLFLLVWFVGSIPVALVVGRLIRTADLAGGVADPAPAVMDTPAVGPAAFAAVR